MSSVWLSGRTPLLIVLAYLLGSIPFGLILARRFARQTCARPAAATSGATNVARVAGPLPGILTPLLDTGKGRPRGLARGTLHGRPRECDDARGHRGIAGAIAIPSGWVSTVARVSRRRSAISCALSLRRSERLGRFSARSLRFGVTFRSAPSPLRLPCLC